MRLTPSLMKLIPVSKQQGAALLIFLVLVVLGGIYFVVGGIRHGGKIERLSNTVSALLRAKQALIGYSMKNDNRPGSMPCPDSDDDGVVDLFSGVDCPSYIGRIPWKTLDLSEYKDQNGEEFWYAISRSYRDHTFAEPVNPFTTPPDLTLDAPGGGGAYVAFIIAPGRPVCNQNRIADIDNPTHNNPANYLELDNNDGDNDYQSKSPGGTSCAAQAFNDIVIGITRADLQTVTKRRIEGIQKEIAVKLALYYNECGAYPWAAPFQDPYSVTSFSSVSGIREGFFPIDKAQPWDWGKDETCTENIEFVRLRQNNWFTIVPTLLSNPIYYAVGKEFVQGKSGACAALGDCLSVLNSDTGVLTQGVSALIIGSGPALGPQARPSGYLSDYYEGQNFSTGDDSYQKGSASGAYNDVLIEVSP